MYELDLLAANLESESHHDIAEVLTNHATVSMTPIMGLEMLGETGIVDELPNVTLARLSDTHITAPVLISYLDDLRREGIVDAVPYLICAVQRFINHTLNNITSSYPTIQVEDVMGYLWEMLCKPTKYEHPADKFPGLCDEVPGYLADEPTIRRPPTFKHEIGYDAYTHGFFSRVADITRNFRHLKESQCESIARRTNKEADEFWDKRENDAAPKEIDWDALDELSDRDHRVVLALMVGESVAEVFNVGERQARNLIQAAEKNLREILYGVSEL